MKGVIVGMQGKRLLLKQFRCLKKSDSHLSCQDLRKRGTVDIGPQLKGYPRCSDMNS